MLRKTKKASVCPQCGASLAPGSTSCQYCGSHFEAEEPDGATKFCKFCGGVIPADAVVCTKCGRQVEELNTGSTPDPRVVINNTYNVRNHKAPLFDNRSYVPVQKPLNKWTAFFLCFFFGTLGIHKFYEGKSKLGILYLLVGQVFWTGGLRSASTPSLFTSLAGVAVCIACFIDMIVLLLKPRTYYV